MIDSIDVERIDRDQKPNQNYSFDVRKKNASIVTEGYPTRNVGFDPVMTKSGVRTDSMTAGWSFANGRLSVFADRLGIVPIYYKIEDSRIVVADSIVELPNHLPDLEIDLFEVYAFLKLGVYLGSATPFSGVHRMRPGETLIWDNGTVARTMPTSDVTPYAGSRDQAMAEAQYLFEESVRKRINNDLQQIVPISGGRDSRHILLELASQRAHGLKAVTVRYMDDYAEEIRVGSLIAHAAAVPHSVVSNDHQHYFSVLAEQISINNFETCLHGWMRALTTSFPGSDRLFFDGIGGDALLNSAYAHVLPNEMFASVQSGDIEHMAETFAGDFNPPKHLRRLPDVRSFATRLKTRLVDEIERHKDAPNVMCRFMFEHRTRRSTGIAPITILGRVAKISLPYLDEDLVKLAFGLPTSEYWAPGFHDQLITRHYPQFKHIPYERNELRAKSRFALRVEFRLMFGYLPLLLCSLGSPIVRRFRAISRYLFCCLRLRMANYFYIAESEVYFQTLRRISDLKQSV